MAQRNDPDGFWVWAKSRAWLLAVIRMAATSVAVFAPWNRQATFEKVATRLNCLLGPA